MASYYSLFIAIPGLAIIIYGGFRLRGVIRDISINTIPGALLIVVAFTRYMVYAGVVGITLMVLLSFLSADLPKPPIYQHPFKVEINEPTFRISDIHGAPSSIATIRDMTGNVNVVGSDTIVSGLLVVSFAIILFLLHWVLVYSEQVLRSLCDRKPFTELNAVLTRRIAGSLFGIWFVYSLYQVAMTSYLRGKLEIEGVELAMVSLGTIEALFIVGLVYVIAEVFRVGYELKQDQSLTV